MRALLIDPFKKEVREVDDDFNDFRTIKAYVAQGELGPLSVTFSQGPRFAENIHSFVDDEGCFRPEQAWFRLLNYPHALAGYCLILGTHFDDEGPVPPWLTSEIMEAECVWVTPEDAKSDFPPVTIRQFDGTVVTSTPVDFDDLRPIKGKAYS